MVLGVPSRLCFHGVAVSGRGEARGFTTLSWVQEEFWGKLGFRPCPGTLNIQLSFPEEARTLKRLIELWGIEITPREGFCAAKTLPAVLRGISCAVIRPQVPGYPEEVTEIMAPVHLRERLDIAEGDRVILEIALPVQNL